jgi:ribose 5-phosphate isomerase
MFSNFYATQHGSVVGNARLGANLCFVVANNHAVIEIVGVRIDIGVVGDGTAFMNDDFAAIVEQQAKRFIVIADESKLVERLGVGVLPVEVTPFALRVLEHRFQAMGLAPVLRLREGAVRITDEGHRILDVRIPENQDIADVVARIREYAGVVETGFFPNEATEAIIAAPTGIRRLQSRA